MELKGLYKILNIISYIILIIGYVFIMIQSIINIIYNNNSKKEIIAERVVYEQFSQVVFKNINSKLIKSIQYSSSCNTNEEIYQLPIKIESYYDCSNHHIDSIDKDFCQNKITSTSLCCEKKCCLNYVTGKKEYKTCKDKDNYYNNQDDLRESTCSKFSVYNGKINFLDSNQICIERLDKSYKDLLKDWETSINNNYYSNYGILDSKGHYLSDIYNNYQSVTTINNRVIVNNLLSMTPPSFFEMESNIKLSIMMNKNEPDEDKIKKRIKALSEISAKNIYDAFNDDKCDLDSCFDKDNYYSKGKIWLDNIISDNSLLSEKFKNNNYIKNQYIIWYTRNYIGFDNSSELHRFQEDFDSNNHKNNCLYKISKTLFPNYTSFIIGFIICTISLLCFIFHLKDYKNIEKDLIFHNLNINFYKFVLIIILFVVYLLMYLIGYYFKFKALYFEMEDFYKKVLKKYNYRRKQLYLVIGVIILGVNLFLELLIQNLKLSFEKPKVEKVPDKKDPIIPINFNGNSVNSIIVTFGTRNGDKRKKLKLYKNKTFKEEIERLKGKIQSYFGNIEMKGFTIETQGMGIDENQEINIININNDDNIIIEQE